MKDLRKRSRSYVNGDGELVVRRGLKTYLHKKIRRSGPGITWILLIATLGLLVIQMIYLMAFYRLSQNPEISHESGPLLYIISGIGMVQVLLVLIIVLSLKPVESFDQPDNQKNFDFTLEDY